MDHYEMSTSRHMGPTIGDLILTDPHVTIAQEWTDFARKICNINARYDRNYNSHEGGTSLNNDTWIW